MLVPRFYEDLNVMHDKTMPARTYYIPASGADQRYFPGGFNLSTPPLVPMRPGGRGRRSRSGRRWARSARGLAVARRGRPRSTAAGRACAAQRESLAMTEYVIAPTSPCETLSHPKHSVYAGVLFIFILFRVPDSCQIRARFCARCTPDCAPCPYSKRPKAAARLRTFDGHVLHQRPKCPFGR